MIDCDVMALAERLRRDPDGAKNIRVLALVQLLWAHWQELSDPLGASDEMPVTAWVVRRKAETLLPRPENVESAPMAGGRGEPEPWLGEAVTLLQQRLNYGRGRPQQSPLAASGPVRVKGASAARLQAAWPKVKPLVHPPEVVIRAATERLSDRLEYWRAVARSQHRALFPDPSEPLSRGDLTGLFLALVVLWNQGELDLVQDRPWEPLEVRFLG